MSNQKKFPLATVFVILFVIVYLALGKDTPAMWFVCLPIYAFILLRCYRLISNKDGDTSFFCLLATGLAALLLIVGLISILIFDDYYDYPFVLCWISLSIEAIVAPVIDFIESSE